MANKTHIAAHPDPVAAGRNQPRIIQQRPQVLFQLLRMRPVIAVMYRYKLAPSHPHTIITTDVRAPIRVIGNKAHPRIVRGISLRYLSRVVATAIINNDNLQLPPALCQQAVQSNRQTRASVVGGNNNTDQRHLTGTFWYIVCWSQIAKSPALLRIAPRNSY